LLPVRAVPLLDKGAGETCRFQKFHKGCTVYGTRQMPSECSLWNCRWLVNDDTADLSRPDRSHYVIDLMPDFVTAVQNDTGVTETVPVAQVWVDPRHREAHHDPALRRWMYRRAQEGIATLVRFNSKDALTVIAPPLASDGQWHEIEGGESVPTHTAREVRAALGPMRAVVGLSE
jgi:hypothetical protein